MLFAYPESTRLNRVLPKSTIYKNAAPSSKQRELLTRQIDKIVWAHKLASDTLNIKAHGDLPEIQVFQLQLKSPLTNISESLLQYLDKAIPSALIFEVQSSAGVQMIACLKHINQNGSVKYSPYLYGPLVDAETERQDLPISRDFLQLHQQLLAALLPHPLKPGESLGEALDRNQQLDKLAKNIHKLEAQLHKKATQFNRRVELNQQLRSAKQAHTALLGK